MAQNMIDAADIFDWDHLVRIGTYLENSQILTLNDAIRAFAYGFTSLANLADQNRLLAEWIQRATHLQSRATAEEILAVLANHGHGNLELLRRFAKQNGVRLKKG